MLYTHVNIATMDPDLPEPYGAITDGAILIEHDTIQWVGPHSEAPKHETTVDLAGAWMTPGLIDCHTHLIFAGNRATEFEQRLSGMSYESIAQAGGGIASTVKATRAASESELFSAANARLIHLIRQGITTIEIKSGYGLDLETEQRMLRVADQLAQAHPNIHIIKTYLGAHCCPPEYKADPDAYIDQVVNNILPTLHTEGLIDHVDCFCETIGFSQAQCMRVLEAARNLGLPIKVHAEQISNLGGTKLAAEYGALSAEHLEYLDEDSIQAMQSAGTVATLLPAAYYFLKETQKPPVKALLNAGVPIALGSDLNPGSAPILNTLLVLNMGCTLFGLTPEQALAGMTRHAAQALGIQNQTGILKPGLRADLALWDISHPAELAYFIGHAPLRIL